MNTYDKLNSDELIFLLAWHIKSLTNENQELKVLADKWWQVYQDRCENAYVEVTILKEKENEIRTLKRTIETLERVTFESVMDEDIIDHEKQQIYQSEQ